MLKNSCTQILIVLLMIMISVSCNERGDGQHGDSSREQAELSHIQSISNQIQQDTSNADLYYQRAILFIEERNIDAAFRDINRAIILQPEDSRFYVALSDIYLMQGKIASCKESLEKAIIIDQSNDDAYLKLAELSLILQDYENTFEYLKKVIEIDQLNPTAYFISAYAFLELEDTTRAIENFRIAVDQDQAYYDAYIYLGNIYAAKKQKLAVDYYNNALNINPQSIEAFYNLGLFYQETGQVDEAVEAYSSLLKIDPDYKFALYNIGFINLVYKKDFERSVQYFTQVIELDQQYFEAYYNRGYAYELMGMLNEARWDYQKTLELEVNYPRAIEGLNRLDAIQFK